jgi:hypothetical protein
VSVSGLRQGECAVREGVGSRCQEDLGKSLAAKTKGDPVTAGSGPKRIKRQEQSTGSGCDIQATIDDQVLDHITTHTAAMPSYTDVPMRERQQVPAKALNTPYPV